MLVKPVFYLVVFRGISAVISQLFFIIIGNELLSLVHSEFQSQY